MAVAALLAGGAVSLAQAAGAIDASTLVLMFALMILSAQFADAGFYDRCAARIVSARVHPHQLLALIVVVAGLLSAILVNDIVVFAMTTLLRRYLCLLALAIPLVRPHVLDGRFSAVGADARISTARRR